MTEETRVGTLPKEIVIGPLTYAVKEVPDLHHSGKPIFGMFYPAGQEITVDSDVPEQRKFVVLWHEVFHAILNHAERNDVPDEVVGVLAFGVVDAMKDNPFLRGEWS